MSALVLVRLPSGAWGLVAVPVAQHVTTERRAQVVREDLADPPALNRRRPAAVEVAA